MLREFAIYMYLFLCLHYHSCVHMSSFKEESTFNNSNMYKAQNVCFSNLDKWHFGAENGYATDITFLYNIQQDIPSIKIAQKLKFTTSNTSIQEYRSRNYTIMHVFNRTYLPDCLNGPVTNLAHFLFGYGNIYALSVNSSFDTVVFLRCPDKKVLNNWPMGNLLYDIIMSKWIVKKPNLSAIKTHPVSEVGLIYYCFQELYMHSHWGVLLPTKHLADKLRNDILVSMGNDRSATMSFPNHSCISMHGKKVSQFQERKDLPLPAHVPVGGLNKWSRNLVIYIFQRHSRTSYHTRKIDNTEEIIMLLQSKFTSVPVLVVTTSPRDSVAEQVKVFNSFDILITPTGSHLANMILARRNIG